VINFWVNDAGSFGIRDFMARDGVTGLAIEPVFYEHFATEMPVRAHVHVFSGLDQLLPAQIEAVETIQTQLQALPGTRILNRQANVLGRYDLLVRMAEAGLNRFRAFRAADDWRAARFPVFIRDEAKHSGARTGLLRSAGDVRRALVSLAARGFRRRDLLVVEFCDTADAHGVYRKYGAMKIGDRILPRHILTSTAWMVKSVSNAPTLAFAEEEMAYIGANPHEAWLRKVFALAGVDYGRADYAVADGDPQLWEINLNPTLGRHGAPRTHPPAIEAVRARRRAEGTRTMLEAFRALDVDASAPPLAVSVRLPQGLLERITVDTRRRQTHGRRLQWLRDLYSHPAVGRPFHRIFRAAFPQRWS
jgi:hypothetical protein